MTTRALLAISALALATACSKPAEQQTEQVADGKAAPVEMSKTRIAEQYNVFGDTIQPGGAESTEVVAKAVAAEKEAHLKLTGQVEQVCQVKGCWMKLRLPDGKLMHITFDNYGFFVPPNAVGQTAILEGNAWQDTVTVEALRHYAEDEGKSETEIAKIDKPEFQYLFNATGVLFPKQAPADVKPKG